TMADHSGTFFYGEGRLTASLALAIARGHCQGRLSEAAREKIRRSAGNVSRIVAQGEPVYGVNTGFGPLCTTHITAEETRILQMNILKSHSVGVGKPIPTERARLMMILKVHSLAQGYSGIGEETLDRILWH